MKNICILSLSVLVFTHLLTISADFGELLAEKSLVITQKVSQSELNPDQHILLLNFLYHMHSYCTHELLKKQKSFELFQITCNIQNYTASNNELSDLLDKAKTTILQLEDSLKSIDKEHFVTYQALDAQITEHEPAITDILTLIQDLGQELTEGYLAESKSKLDELLVEQKKLLEFSARTNYTVAHTFKILLEKPETFNFDKDLENTLTINLIHNVLKPIKNTAYQLLAIKDELSPHIQSLQEVVADFIALIYNNLYAQIKMHYPEKSMRVLKVTQNNSFISSSRTLPDKIKMNIIP